MMSGIKLVNGATLMALGNMSLGWEKTRKLNIGAGFGIMERGFTAFSFVV